MKKDNNLYILGKKILFEESPILYSFKATNLSEKNISEYFDIKKGQWTIEDGYLIGKEPGNEGGIIYTNKKFTGDVIVTMYLGTCLPATRDVNAVWCSSWDEETDYLKDSYVCGLNGWYDGLSGLERCGENGFYVSTSLYKYKKGEIVKMQFGSINGHCFLFVNDELIIEMHDPHPLNKGYVGVSPYCTILKVKEIEVRQIVFTPREQRYEPEF